MPGLVPGIHVFLISQQVRHGWPGRSPAMTKNNKTNRARKAECFWGDRAVTVSFNRQGAGWEAAHAALFPISNESSYVSAHTLFFDGGHPDRFVRG